MAVVKNQLVATEPVFRQASPSFPMDLNKLLHAIVDVVCVINHKGIFQFLSPGCSHLFGYSHAEMTGCSFINFIHPDDIDKTVALISELAPGNNIAYFENRYIKKDGTYAFIIWSARWDEATNLFYCVARNGEKKEEVEQRLFKAQRVAKVANYEFDLVNGCYTYTSDTIFDIFGVDRKLHPQFTSGLFWSLVHPEDLELVKQHIPNAEKTNNSTLEFRIIRPDGQVVYINRTREIIKDDAGRLVKNIGMVQDVTERKVSELALQQSEVRFRSLVQNSGDMLAVIDSNGHYTYVSENIKDHLGYQAANLLGKNLYQFIHPEDTNRIAAGLQHLADKQTISSIPFRLKNHKNQWRWVEATVTNHLANPAISGFVCNARDITQRKEKEDEARLFQQRLEEQNQMMVEVLEQTRDGFITVSLQGKIIYWNASAERITGLLRKDTLGKDILNLYPGIEFAPYYQVYKRLQTSHAPIQEIVFSAMQQRWVELRAYRTKKGISVFFRDITKRITAEEELRKLSLIARETSNPVIMQDKDRKVQWVNEAFTNLTGYTLEECQGKLIGEICDGPETDPNTVSYVQEKINNCEPFRLETINYKKNGETYWSDVSCQPIFDSQGAVFQYFSIATDITERKRLEKQLEREQRKLHNQIAAATLKAQEHERSVVSQELHDNVNQVLTTVKLYTEMCRDGFGNREEILNKSIKLLQDSINEIRSLSKRLSAPSLGKIKLNESIKELVDAVAATQRFEIRLDTSGIQDLDVDQEVHLALYRILQEHLTNILKHAEASSIEVVLEYMMGNITLRVADNGSGFDTTKKSKGIGIANMITRAESIQGTLSIESAPGQGCVLQTRIPLLWDA